MNSSHYAQANKGGLHGEIFSLKFTGGSCAPTKHVANMGQNVLNNSK